MRRLSWKSRGYSARRWLSQGVNGAGRSPASSAEKIVMPPNLKTLNYVKIVLRSVTTWDRSSRRQAADKDRSARGQAAVRRPGCPWRPCTARRPYRIAPAASRRRRPHCRRRQHCRRPGRSRRPVPRLFPHAPPPIRSPRRQAPQAPCPRQRCQARPDWPPHLAIGSRSPAGPKSDRLIVAPESVVRLPLSGQGGK
jgi:hypothetical protein